MAFKMKGFNPGKGTGMGSALLKKEKSKLRKKLDESLVKRKTKRAEVLREKAAKLRDKKAGSKRADRLEARAQAKETRAGVKEKMAKNVSAGKDKKADLVDNRGKQTPGMQNRSKTFDSAGKKTDKVAPKSDAGLENMTFKEAFRSARNAGKKIFTYKGKKYTTQTRSEASKGKVGGKTKAQFDKMSPEEKAKFTMDNAFKMSPKKMSPKKMSPKKMSPKKMEKMSPKNMSPKKMSPKKMEKMSPNKLDMTSAAKARRERARLKEEREEKRKRSTSSVDKTSMAYKKRMAGL